LGTDEKRGTTFRSGTDDIFETFSRIAKLDKGKTQCIREKTVEKNIIKEIKQYKRK
jgi:hypothetical protein